MKKLLLIIALVFMSSQTWAYMSLVSCRYEWSSDLNGNFYVGTYRAMSGKYYIQYFPANRFGWCPQSI